MCLKFRSFFKSICKTWGTSFHGRISIVDVGVLNREHVFSCTRFGFREICLHFSSRDIYSYIFWGEQTCSFIVNSLCSGKRFCSQLTLTLNVGFKFSFEESWFEFCYLRRSILCLLNVISLVLCNVGCCIKKCCNNN